MMNDDTKVSIVIPIYNAEKYLQECLDSVIKQTYQNLEIICVDDGSTDSSRDIVREYMRVNNRVVLLEEEHYDAGHARNVGMDHATGEYIVFLDADDIFMPELIEKHVELVERNNADITICKYIAFDNGSQRRYLEYGNLLREELLPMGSVFSGKDISDVLFQITNTWVWDKMYRRSFLRQNHIRFQEISTINDALFCCMAFAHAKRIVPVIEELIIHRSNISTSIEGSRAKNWKCAEIMLDELGSELKRRNIYNQYETSYMNLAASRMIYYMLGITDEHYFRECFDYCKGVMLDKYGFLSYPKSAFLDSNVYELIFELERCTESQFLCACRRNEGKRLIDIYGGIYDMRMAYQNAYDMQDQFIADIKKKKMWIFPNKDIPNGSRIILYGYGDVGKDYAEYIRMSGCVDLICIADKNHEKYINEDIRIISPEDISKEQFDYVVISIYSSDIAEQVRDNLLMQGIAAEKIVWSDPGR